MTVRPLQGARSNVAAAIVESLRQDIVTGRLPPGGRLPAERELAAHFEVSQPTVREALRGLEALGLVDVRHGSGVYARADGSYPLASALQTLMQLEDVTILDVLAVREVLGRESVRLAAETVTAADLETAVAHLDRLSRPAELSSVEEIVDELVAFQTALARASHNPLLSALESFLATLLLQMQIKVLRKRGVEYWRERSLSFHADRRALVAAVESGDARKAVRAMEAYLDHQRQVFLGDGDFARLGLSEDRAVQALAEIVLAARDR